MADLKGKNVVVTGGAGFIGSHLVEALAFKELRSLYVLDNFFLGTRENLIEAQSNFPKLKIENLDCTEFEKLKNYFTSKNIDVVFDLATSPLPASLEKPLWASKVIYDLTLNLCELQRLGLFKTLIHCSSSEVYGTAQYVPMDEKHPLKTETPYAAAKAGASLLVESYFRTFRTDMAIARPFNTFGPRQNGRDFSGIIPRLIKNILSGKTPQIFGDGLQTRDYLYVSETARGLIKIYEREETRGKSVNLASGQEVSVLKIVEDVIRLMKWTKAPEFLPERPGDVRRHCAKTEQAKSILDFSNELSWDEGISKTVQWYKDNPQRLLN
jgi:UDP-glucose 4-epimerase